MSSVQEGDFTFRYDTTVIGWGEKDGKRCLITDHGFTVYPVTGYVFDGDSGTLEEVDDYIEKCKEEARRTGKVFPKFRWYKGAWWEVKEGE